MEEEENFVEESISGKEYTNDVRLIDTDFNNENPMKMAGMVEEEDASEEDIMTERWEYNPIVSFVESEYRKAKSARQDTETRWLDCYRNFIGRYDNSVRFTSTEKSRAFIKVTKTKVLAAAAKINEVLFSGLKFPIGVEPSPVPEGMPESIHVDPISEEEKQLPEPVIDPAISRPELMSLLNSELKAKLEVIPEDKAKIKEGPGVNEDDITFHPAVMAARKMEQKMHDQLEEANAKKHIRSFTAELALFGTGVMKGPFVKEKEYPKWDEEGNYQPAKKLVPDLSFVSIWNIYPDPDARSPHNLEKVVERHRMSKSQLRKLKKRPFFRKQSIEQAIKEGSNYVDEYWETMIDDSEVDVTPNSDRYEVLEYWGIVDVDDLEEWNVEDVDNFEIPDGVDELQVNIWVCNGYLLRLVLNPFTPHFVPYYICPYEINPYSVWGVGVAENMLDTQMIMNGFFRLAIDNAALSSNVVFEVDETNLVPGQDLAIYPGKVFRRQGGAPGQAIFSTKFQNVTQECMMLFDKARQLADESTGLPSYSHGMSGVMSTGRTASGMSMLMNAAAENIKDVVRNVDDYFLVPFGKNLYSFNMQFDFDPEIKGDLGVVAKGTESLMRNEIRSEKLMQFVQIASQEMFMPFVKFDYILREYAKALDLDPDKIINDPRQAMLQAIMMKNTAQAMGKNPEEMGNEGMASQASGTAGDMAQGAGVPSPESAQFSGSEGAAMAGGMASQGGM